MFFLEMNFIESNKDLMKNEKALAIIIHVILRGTR